MHNHLQTKLLIQQTQHSDKSQPWTVYLSVLQESGTCAEVVRVAEERGSDEADDDSTLSSSGASDTKRACFALQWSCRMLFSPPLHFRGASDGGYFLASHFHTRASA